MSTSNSTTSDPPTKPPTSPPTSPPTLPPTPPPSNSTEVPPPTSNSSISTPLTTSIVTTIIVTSDGQVFTQTKTSATVLPPGATITLPPKANRSQNNTAPIVGGVVGGIAFLLVLIIATWLYLRRQRQKRLEKVFDGNFDPARTSMSTVPGSAGLAGAGLGAGLGAAAGAGAYGSMRHRRDADGRTIPDATYEDDGMGGRLAGTEMGGGVVSPYVLSPQSHSVAPSHYGSLAPGMVGHGPHHPGGNYPPSSYDGYSASPTDSTFPNLPNPHSMMPVPMAGAYNSSRSGTPPSTHRSGSPTNTHYTSSSAGMPLMGAAAGRQPGLSTVSDSSYQTSQQHFAVANPDAAFAGGSSLPMNPNKSQPMNLSGGGPVMVHQDGGRVRQQEEENEGPSEIPPTYDSIPKD